jgi:hypothetical protein
MVSTMSKDHVDFPNFIRFMREMPWTFKSANWDPQIRAQGPFRL